MILEIFRGQMVWPSVPPKFPSDIRKDAARFGSNYLAKFGWDCSKGLGASGEGMTSHIKVSHKLDMLGIGAAHQRDPNGIAWKQNKDFENLLKRLNGEGPVESFKKPEEVVEDCQDEEKEKKRKKKREVGEEPGKKKRKKNKDTEKEESGLVELSIPIGASVTGVSKSTSSLPRYRACVVFSIFYLTAFPRLSKIFQTSCTSNRCQKPVFKISIPDIGGLGHSPHTSILLVVHFTFCVSIRYKYTRRKQLHAF